MAVPCTQVEGCGQLSIHAGLVPVGRLDEGQSDKIGRKYQSQLFSYDEIIVQVSLIYQMSFYICKDAIGVPACTNSALFSCCLMEDTFTL